MAFSYGQDTYIDNFNSVRYDRNNGTENWSTNWIETNDDGDSDDGEIYIEDNRLTFNKTEVNTSIKRSADISAATSATLSFNWETEELDDKREITIQISSNGSSYTTLWVLTGESSGFFSQDISAYIGTNTTVRFINDGEKKLKNKGYAFVDNLKIETVVMVSNAPPMITATGDQSYCPGSAIPVVETISITDSDDTTASEVSIQISSGYVSGEDLLTLTGSHPSISANWSASEGKLTLTGPATYTAFEAAISAVEYSSSGTNPSGSKDFSITIGDPNYLPATDHYYEYVSDVGISWTDAHTAASSRTYFGLQGYLATLTSQVEADFSGSQATGVGWIGASDAANEGDWKWMSGPEAGDSFWSGGVSGTELTYAFWNNNEPNNSGNEDYAHISHPNVNSNGSWNDLPNGGGSGNYEPKGYVVEYGGMPGDPVLNISATTSITIEPSPVITSTVPASRCGAGSVVLGASASIGELRWYATTSGGSVLGSGTNFTTPTIATTTTFYVAAENNGCAASARTAVVATIDTAAEIDTQATNLAVFDGDNALFSVETSNADSFQWQVSTNGGLSFSPITNGATYSGTQTEDLTVNAATTAQNDYRYRVLVSSTTSSCPVVVSSQAILTVKVKTVVTNKKITYRIKK
ncbi:hypothetical protein MWU65_09940 [Cellulophaga sp. F20128]|uniref:Ig-like domain-containing protein n=1 Tax=Cellulophaga sp. F20128 TaxID=2926413 RepID=UPI001FF10F64|nr:lectin-like protein [Cellulophaga sp. F20128]MCK0157499.1 hypothetical protein [Cellulophaga sp. F20128]